MASYKKASARRARRLNPVERDIDPPAMLPDFLVRRLSAERLKTVTNRIVLQHWRD